MNNKIEVEEHFIRSEHGFDSHRVYTKEIWDSNKVDKYLLPFVVQDTIPILKEMRSNADIIFSNDMYVDPEHRNKGEARELMQKLKEKVGEDNILLFNVGAIKLEYPEEPSKEEREKIVSNLITLYTILGYCEISKYSDSYRYFNTMIYPNKEGKKLLKHLKER